MNIFEKFSNLCFTTLCFILLNFVQNFLNSYFPSTFILDKEEKTCPYFFHKSLTSFCTFILVWLFITWFAWVSFILLVVGAITCTVFPSLLIFYFFNFIYLTLSFFRTTCTYSTRPWHSIGNSKDGQSTSSPPSLPLSPPPMQILSK